MKYHYVPLYVDGLPAGVIKRPLRRLWIRTLKDPMGTGTSCGVMFWAIELAFWGKVGQQAVAQCDSPLIVFYIGRNDKVIRQLIIVMGRLGMGISGRFPFVRFALHGNRRGH